MSGARWAVIEKRKKSIFFPAYEGGKWAVESS